MALRSRLAAPRHPLKPAANAGLTLFVSADALASDWALLVLHEKDVDGAIVTSITPGRPDEDFLVLNPAQTLPTIADREGVIAGARVIVEYLEERYPHPPLMPLSPAGRARVRMSLTRIEQDLFPLAMRLGEGRGDVARKTLQAALDDGLRVFPVKGWFTGADYSLVDTAWAVLLRSLHRNGFDLARAPAPLQGYAQRLFAREAFQRSFLNKARVAATRGVR